MNKIYITKLYKMYDVNNSAFMMDKKIYNSLEDAIETSKKIIEMDCSKINNFCNTDINLNTVEDYNNYLKYLEEKYHIDYEIFISEVYDIDESDIGRKFIDYCNDTKDNDPEDFILSLGNSNNYIYDYNGNRIGKFL